MSEVNQFVLMAEYNKLMNQRQYATAKNLSDTDLLKDTGAFFKSVLGTLNHILVVAILSGLKDSQSILQAVNYCRMSDHLKNHDH